MLLSLQSFSTLQWFRSWFVEEVLVICMFLEMSCGSAIIGPPHCGTQAPAVVHFAGLSIE